MKVLIVEDDRLIGEGLAAIIEQEGHAAVLARDGAAGLARFRAERPQLVLLDIMMPGQDGYAVCRQIRALDSEVAVIFISAKSEEIDRVVALELGADDYILKPFGTREVIARIRAVTRRSLRSGAGTGSAGRPGALDAAPFVLDDLTVYPAELRARRGAQTIELSLRDVQILHALHSQRGKVVDRDTLFNLCWGRDYVASSRTLDQHVSKLRKLIELDPKNPRIIRTAPRVGYRAG